MAARFQTDIKWSQKALLREIVLSRVYCQSAKTPPALLERDPAFPRRVNGHFVQVLGRAEVRMRT